MYSASHALDARASWALYRCAVTAGDRRTADAHLIDAFISAVLSGHRARTEHRDISPLLSDVSELINFWRSGWSGDSECYARPTRQDHGRSALLSESHARDALDCWLLHNAALASAKFRIAAEYLDSARACAFSSGMEAYREGSDLSPLLSDISDLPACWDTGWSAQEGVDVLSASLAN
ncbi:hypothetical protein [Burkholderia ubonensis]|uniref:hypothetical protein n=1 Tax=Burkholderia ubonensis TaxID=101571 RepID=UPI000AE78E29|nr:hypothetical protein [Burkholderia ubonensis]